MRKSLLGMALVLGGFAAATPALAADYAPPPPPVAYYPMPVQPPCCCPTVQRGLWISPSACGANLYYPPAAPVYYRPGYAPQVAVGVEYRTTKPRKHCWRHHGHWVCR